MNRCTFRYAATLLLTAAALSAWPALAQTDGAPVVREFPKTALRGEMVVLAPPEISMDGKPDRLAPGARLRDSANLLVLTGQVINQKLTVNYLRDNMGLVQQVWILSEAEAELKRPNSPASLFNFVFGSSASTAPNDDGETPYHSLPSYKP
ncbi:MAG: hypothetical protein B7X59_07100 [Polaromonas sp. 39-63-203]|jgi:hypothetical protein|uniref:hypothetical protein n=1 Tax=Polaromonas sp. TaxID=1869339 RepID=UPI000BD43AD5|nr:hypothetical protein [Polaromonas sp.]OYY53030.1 MAG: hypothetical protein B7Y54_04655 [Polaromonas sp. 35-63-240]OYY96152.1 MAG: hypothetical protein B7Y42_09860 [Polaromonas sp. 28-63-22]OYZ83341.1 MAG: hypothetical protein B7Y03_09720 [Polaromonas sp. 24-62-144]OZA97898.1 MAG: hypothetical protein B7X59_07100 [Polaromonas sp. 39-63-203]HQS30736.1 hypothetical protein [Polaromonas sp.]